MVVVTFGRDRAGRLASAKATGHAEFGEFPNDVVCAAVSAILQAACAGLEEVARVPYEGSRTPGELSFLIPADARDRADVAAIVATAEVSLEQLERQYPDHVRVTHINES
ncbi:MAG: ribosomal-processing cysteine protease Prp [Candidatus Eremiobacteraeota bacterium]|nr:ribosomal-processing cysteine protease Prp [Candidatus Eremiobacteraeota bacterium]